MFSKKQTESTSLPPTRETLRQKVLRSHYTTVYGKVSYSTSGSIWSRRLWLEVVELSILVWKRWLHYSWKRYTFNYVWMHGRMQNDVQEERIEVLRIVQMSRLWNSRAWRPWICWWKCFVGRRGHWIDLIRTKNWLIFLFRSVNDPSHTTIVKSSHHLALLT